MPAGSSALYAYSLVCTALANSARWRPSLLEVWKYPVRDQYTVEYKFFKLSSHIVTYFLYLTEGYSPKVAHKVAICSAIFCRKSRQSHYQIKRWSTRTFPNCSVYKMLRIVSHLLILKQRLRNNSQKQMYVNMPTLNSTCTANFYHSV